MARPKRILVEYEREPLFDFGALVVLCLLLGGCALGVFAAITL